MLTDKELKTLQNIVSSRWVFTDPCMLDTYSFYMNPETLNKEGGRWTPRPVAVVLPEKTEEIQEIMRLCNTTDLMAKPLSTGFHTVAAASRDRVIILDLKRMNKIIDIDVDNQIAVIEPYVKAYELQTELFKHGLNVHIISSGSNHSILASHAAAWGYGFSGPSTSFSGRNLLGVEWVLPTGELFTLGSGAVGKSWFTADGPGPSLRGILRGFSGTFGGLGVFTKCAVKLYPWAGPDTWEVAGKAPVYHLTEYPDNIKMNIIAFPTAQAMKDAGYKLGEADIEYAQFRTPMFFVALGLTENNEELKTALETGIFEKIAGYVLVNAVVGNSRGELRWKMKAQRQILRETGGVSLPLNIKPSPKMLEALHRMKHSRFFGKLLDKMKDPLMPLRRLPFLQELVSRLPIGKQDKIETYSRLFWLLIRNAVNAQATSRPSQGMNTMMGSFDTWDLGVEQSEWIARAKQKYMKQGVIVDDGGDLGCGGTYEGGHLGYLEGIILYNTKDLESIVATGELIAEGIDATIDDAMGIPIAGMGCEMNARLGPECGNYHIWQSKIKKAFDPNTASDPFFYAEPDEGE
jgi:hypothetical protein